MLLVMRIVLVAYMVALLVGVGIFCIPNVVPEDGTVVLAILCLQLTYPLFLRATAAQAWTGAWRVLRIAHGITFVVVLLVIGIAFLATPDVSGFSS